MTPGIQFELTTAACAAAWERCQQAQAQPWSPVAVPAPTYDPCARLAFVSDASRQYLADPSNSLAVAYLRRSLQRALASLPSC